MPVALVVFVVSRGEDAVFDRQRREDVAEEPFPEMLFALRVAREEVVLQVVAEEIVRPVRAVEQAAAGFPVPRASTRVSTATKSVSEFSRTRERSRLAPPPWLYSCQYFQAEGGWATIVLPPTRCATTICAKWRCCWPSMRRLAHGRNTARSPSTCSIISS